jgi:hypothetical protein
MVSGDDCDSDSVALSFSISLAFALLDADVFVAMDMNKPVVSSPNSCTHSRSLRLYAFEALASFRLSASELLMDPTVDSSLLKKLTIPVRMVPTVHEGVQDSGWKSLIVKHICRKTSDPFM